MENIDDLKGEIFEWAAECGQEQVAIEITRMWFLMGCIGTVKLHPIEDQNGIADWKAINNNRQQIFRWLRGETKAAQVKQQELARAMELALPEERRARLGMSTQYLLCVAIREFAAAIISLILDARDSPQRVTRATQAMQQTQQIANHRRLTSV